MLVILFIFRCHRGASRRVPRKCLPLAETIYSAQRIGHRRPQACHRPDPPLAVCRHQATQLIQDGRPALTAEAESRAFLSRKRNAEHGRDRLGVRCTRSRPLVANFHRNTTYFARSTTQYGTAGRGEESGGGRRRECLAALSCATAIGRSRRFRHRGFSADGEKQPSGRA